MTNLPGNFSTKPSATTSGKQPSASSPLPSSTSPAVQAAPTASAIKLPGKASPAPPAPTTADRRAPQPALGGNNNFDVTAAEASIRAQIQKLEADLKAKAIGKEDKENETILLFNSTAKEIDNIDDKFTEKRTLLWIEYGKVLIDLKTEVKSLGKPWYDWAIKNIQTPKETQRRYIMSIALHVRAKDLAFMGVEKIYKMLKKLGTKFKEDDFTEIARRMGLNKLSESRTSEEHLSFNLGMNKLIEYYKAVNTLKDISSYKELLIRAISVGCKFKKANYKEIELIKDNNEALYDHFFRIIANKTPGMRTDPSYKRQSIFIQLASLGETIDEYIKNKKWPKHLRTITVDEVIKKLEELKLLQSVNKTT